MCVKSWLLLILGKLCKPFVTSLCIVVDVVGPGDYACSRSSLCSCNCSAELFSFPSQPRLAYADCQLCSYYQDSLLAA